MVNLFDGKPLILASRSARRQSLLTDAGIVFQTVPAEEEAEMPIPRDATPPDMFVMTQAKRKAENVVRRLSGRDCMVLGCDTVAVCGGEILGKPTGRADARRMLRMLSGREHEVVSGICLQNPADPAFERLEAVTTRLFMEPLSEAMLEAYLDTGKWEGKAGAFGYQDGNDWIRVLAGSEANVVGLPVERLIEIGFSSRVPLSKGGSNET